MRYKDVLSKQRKVIREILTGIEDLVKKYDITPEEYHRIRMIVKTRVIGINNIWHYFFATVVDAKFEKKVNEDGELPETHLRANGKNISE